MKNDSQIQQDVIYQLKWNPFLKVSEIGVSVKHGIVTLSGTVNSYAQKVEAEKCAKKVVGVRGIAQDIQIAVSPMIARTDAEIAESVLNALKWHSAVPDDLITVKVEDGVVTIDGELEWEYQRSSAKHVVSNLNGVTSVVDRLKLKPRASVVDVENKISAAFHRTATIDAERIAVEVAGKTAILRGKVRSYAEKEDAEDAAWSAPGISTVVNYLELVPEEEYTF